MNETFRVVKLPVGSITVKPTGKMCKVREVPDGGLFLFDGHIWEKCGSSNFCLSDLHTDASVLDGVKVEQWEVQPAEREEPWTPYQPHRRREKEFHDIKLRDGTIVECCWPNGIHWTPMVKGPHSHKRFADYRVSHIRKCKHPMDRDDLQ